MKRSCRKSIKFEHLEEHKASHKALIQEIVGILTRLKTDENYNALDLIEFLEHWVTDHIIKEDMLIGPAYKQAIAQATTA